MTIFTIQVFISVLPMIIRFVFEIKSVNNSLFKYWTNQQEAEDETQLVAVNVSLKKQQDQTEEKHRPARN